MSVDKHTIAIHEAGHAVAIFRLGIGLGAAAVVPDEDHWNLGGCAGTARGIGPPADADEAAKCIIACCSGYAALLVAGYDRETALAGTDHDLRLARHLIDFHKLHADISEWQSRAVALMREPQNVAAVTLIAGRLEQEKTIRGDVLDLLVDLSDGKCSQAELDAYMLMNAETELEHYLSLNAPH